MHQIKQLQLQDVQTSQGWQIHSHAEHVEPQTSAEQSSLAGYATTERNSSPLKAVSAFWKPDQHIHAANQQVPTCQATPLLTVQTRQVQSRHNVPCGRALHLSALHWSTAGVCRPNSGRAFVATWLIDLLGVAIELSARSCCTPAKWSGVQQRVVAEA